MYYARQFIIEGAYVHNVRGSFTEPTGVSPILIFLCDECGCLVMDTGKHDDFHAKLEEPRDY